MNPFLSILITSYNREAYISEAIESVLSSTYMDFEIIISDDCSTDNTVAIALSYATKDNRVKVYVNEYNLGQFKNRNKAASLATGKYLKYLDSDDKFLPNGLEKMILGVTLFPDAGIGVEHVFGSRVIDKDKLPLKLDPQISYQYHFEKGGLLFAGPSFCIYKADTFNKVGGFDLNLGINVDILLNLKIAAISETIVLEKSIIYWRRHDKQVHEGQADQFSMLKEKFDIHKQILFDHNCPLSSNQKSRFFATLKILYARNLFKNFLFKGRPISFLRMLSSNRVSFHQLPLALVPVSIVKMIYR